MGQSTRILILTYWWCMNWQGTSCSHRKDTAPARGTVIAVAVFVPDSVVDSVLAAVFVIVVDSIVAAVIVIVIVVVIEIEIDSVVVAVVVAVVGVVGNIDIVV